VKFLLLKSITIMSLFNELSDSMNPEIEFASVIA